jgi:hypothetical protein
MGVLCIYSSVFYAYVTIFDIDNNPDEHFRGFFSYSAAADQDMMFFVFFVLDMLKNMVTDFQPIGQLNHNRKFLDILNRYLLGEFVVDLLCLIPFHWLFWTGDFEFGRHVFYIKVLRLLRASSLISIRKI